MDLQDTEEFIQNDNLATTFPSHLILAGVQKVQEPSDEAWVVFGEFYDTSGRFLNWVSRRFAGSTSGYRLTLKPISHATSKNRDCGQTTARCTLNIVPWQSMVRSAYLSQSGDLRNLTMWFDIVVAA